MQDHEQIYAYTRTLNQEKWLIVLNFSGEPVMLDLPDGLRTEGGRMIITNYPEDGTNAAELRPYEARVYGLKV